jgi:hypothetical protein
MVNLLFVCFIFFLLFGIVGVNFFKGAFSSCQNLGHRRAATKLECMDYGGSWVNNRLNFDNILYAIVTLFVIASTEGWIDMMWQGVDCVGIDQ